MATLRKTVVDTLCFDMNIAKDAIIKLEGTQFNSAWYAAILYEDVVTAYVVLVEGDDLDELRVKPVPEEMGPFAFEPSARLLDLLSPTQNETAMLWRQACRKLIAEEEIVGSPYQKFSDSFMDDLDQEARQIADAEREAYLRGITDRMDNKPAEANNDPHFVYYMEGWIWAETQFDTNEIMDLDDHIPHIPMEPERDEDSFGGLRFETVDGDIWDVSFRDLLDVMEDIPALPQVFLDVKAQLIEDLYDPNIFMQVGRIIKTLDPENQHKMPEGELLNVTIICLVMRLQAADRIDNLPWVQDIILQGGDQIRMFAAMAAYYSTAKMFYSSELNALVFDEADARRALEQLAKPLH